MINVSNEFKQKMESDKRNFLIYLDITLKDGTKIETLDNSDLWENGLKISDGVTASNQFTVGSCIINKLTVTLNNIYDKFSEYDFDGAVVTVHLGLKLDSGKIEKIRKGVFIVDEPSYNGTTITLECLDYMSKFDVDYKEVKTPYPATLGEIVRDICNYCGVQLNTPAFSNYNLEIKERPEDEALTCRQVLAYAAQLSCGFARCDTYGRLEIRWFEQTIFEKNDNLDGGIFDDGTPQYTSGDQADGGNFDDYSSGVSADGGTFDDLDFYHHLYSLNGFSVCTDDVVITGVSVTEEFAETEKEKKNTVLNGTEGYVLSISGNKFIQKGDAEKIASYLGSKLIGLRFRPMSTQALSDPTIEAGDLAYVTDRKQNTYHCFITNLTFNLGSFMSVSCDAETPSKNSAKGYTEMTQAIIAARKNAQAQISEYDLAVQALTNLITQSFGVYKTAEELEDGSIIYYMHDKPTLEESMTIWKMTANAFAVSTDGGKTWNAGMDSSGNAVVNVLSAIGINCDWIHAGTLTLGGYNNQNGKMTIQDASGNEIGRWDSKGVSASGRFESKNTSDGSSVIVENGYIYIKNKAGKLTGAISYINGGITIDVLVGSNPPRLTLSENGNIMLVNGRGKGSCSIGGGEFLSLSADNISISGGKTGTAEFSDGSYLQFKSGILVGGRTASGSTF